MSVAHLTPPKPTAPSLSEFGEQRLLLYDIDWQSYQRFLEAVGSRRIRLTFDRGTLEIMTISSPHEWWKRRFGFVLPFLGAILSIGVQGYGTTSLRREDLDRGLEPDEGFYVGNQIRMVGPRNIDLNRDPAPNLAIEIDISRSSLNRLAIYAALRIAEVWRFDGESLQVYRLRTDGGYELSERSMHFPSLSLTAFVEFLQQTEDLKENELILPLQEWLRSNVLPGQQKSTESV